MTQTPPPPSGQPYEGQRDQGHPQQGYPQQAGDAQRTYGYEPPTGHQQHQPPSYASAPTSLGGDERTMMLLAHLSAPLAMLLSVGWVPFLGPFLIWLFYKDKSQAVRAAAAGAFNFNVTLSLISIGLWISVFLTLGLGFLWAIPGWIALFVIQLWAHIKGAIRASEGRVYDYPMQIRILS